MTRILSCLAMAAVLSGCHVTHDIQTNRFDRVHAFIAERLAGGHPSRGPMLIYASSLDQMLRQPEDPTAVRAMMIATNCLGLYNTGTLVSETRREVDAMMTDTDDRRDAYRRYVVASSEIALTARESRCMEQ